MAERQVVRGRVTELKERQEWFSLGPVNLGTQPLITVYGFVVEHFDDEGNLEKPIAVEVRSAKGHKIAGTLDDGDEVAFFTGDSSAGGVLQVSAVRNLTTDTLFGHPKAVRRQEVPQA